MLRLPNFQEKTLKMKIVGAEYMKFNVSTTRDHNRSFRRRVFQAKDL